jgi:hypothetical protein
MVTVIVNGVERELTGNAIGYEDLMALAIRTPSKGLLTITWRKKDGSSGTIAPGQFIQPIEDMIFNVATTSRS